MPSQPAKYRVRRLQLFDSPADILLRVDNNTYYISSSHLAEYCLGYGYSFHVKPNNFFTV